MQVTADNIFELARDSSNLNEITKTFASENERTCLWFESHGALLASYLRLMLEHRDLDVKIMGSHRWKTNHLLSDIDAVIVTAYDNPASIMERLAEFYQLHYKDVSQFRTVTKAGLYLLVMKDFADPHLSKMKLEYTIQSPAINQKLITEMSAKLVTKFATTEEKTVYALEMMKAVRDNNMPRQMELKGWTRVLAEA